MTTLHSSSSLCTVVIISLLGLILLLSYQSSSPIQSGYHALRRLETEGSHKYVAEFWKKKQNSSNKKNSTSKSSLSSVMAPLNFTSMNQIQFVYIVGVEGSGQNDVAAAIATIGKTCAQHVVLKNPSQRASRMYKRGESLKSYINLSKTMKYGLKEVLIIDEQSFPSGDLLINSTSAEKREQGKYGIDWVYDQLANDVSIKLKVVYVNRDVYQAATSVSTENAPFRARVDASIEFVAYIDEEHARVSAKKAGIWTQVTYESFANMENCTSLVSGVADFMQWSMCDVDFACQVLRDTFRVQPERELVGDHVLYVQDTHATLHIPSIPVLDISDDKAHSFGTYVSARKSFSFTDSKGKGAAPKRAKYKGGERIAIVPKDNMLNFTGNAINTLSYLYIVGVEGVGHHGVTPAIASIAKTCNYHVLYESETLRRSWFKSLPNTYKSTLEAYKRHKVKNVNKILILEDQSFPSDNTGRVSTPEQKKNTSAYNLEWLFNQTRAVGVDMKFLHLKRDFYRAVASHPEFDRGFEPHARVLHDYLLHIQSEYRTIDSRAPGLWREVQYESFTKMHNCTALVSAVIEFMQWDQCDVEFACDIISSTVRSSHKNRTVDAVHYAFSNQFNSTLPIPALNIAPRSTYNFSTVVSARKPFSFITNMTSRGRTRFSPYAHFSMRGRNTSSIKYAPIARSSNNNVSFMYVVGIDGAGNSAVSSALIAIAESCNYRVIFKPKSLWRAQTKILPRTYFSTMTAIAHSVYKDTNKVLILEDTPMGQGERRLDTSSEEKRRQGKNNLFWVYGRLLEYGVQSARFLYVNRPVADMVQTVHSAGTGKNSLSVEDQGRLVGEYAAFLHEEYVRIAHKDNTTWGQVEYEWFERSVGNNSEVRGAGGVRASCNALIGGLMEFAGWSECDITDACDKLAAMNFPALSVDKSKYSVLKGLDRLNATASIPFIANN